MSIIKIDSANRLHRISPVLYGIFFEDINYGGDGGLYGELIPNRSFEYYDKDKKQDKHKMCWEAAGGADFRIMTENPLNNVHTHYAAVSGGKGCGIKNIGWCGEGFAVKDGDVMCFSCYTSCETYANFLVKITDGDGNIYASALLCAENKEWIKHENELRITGGCKNAFLEIVLPEGGNVNFEFISLFPKDTFMGRKNGLRRDLAEMIRDLKPKFMRFPGGCIVEGRSVENMYNWKDTVGSVEERKTNWNRWQMEEYQPTERGAADYFQSYGLGFYEYFQFCEDIGAKPVPVVNCGMTCQWHEGILIDTDKLDSYIQDVFDLIEFANGDEACEWGRRRTEMGHPKPFGLEYIGIGNEQWGKEYFERYEIFQRKISERYPEIKLITSAGWDAAGWEFDIAEEWMSKNKDKAYAVDEHFYKSPEWFLDNISRYDSYDRTVPKVFIGEYAAHAAKNMTDRKNNWKTALAEAAFLTGVEKNSDHVVMAAYAPLLARMDHHQWQPNMIWFDNESVYRTPNYYVQRLFSENIGEYALSCEADDDDIKTAASVSENGCLIIKAVNISGKEKTIDFELDSRYKVCRATELAASPDAENSMDNPCRIYPVNRECDFADGCKIKPYSVNIFELCTN